MMREGPTTSTDHRPAPDREQNHNHDPGGNARRVVWLNGRFIPLEEASISPLDRGFQYGDGVFETMRAESGFALYVREHLERLRNSLEALRIPARLPADIEDIPGELLLRNNLEGDTASVKLMVSRGPSSPGMGLPDTPASPTVCMIAQSYTPPGPHAYMAGWRLHVCAEGFSPPLSAHKTLNYLFFMAARQAAVDAGADEAVIIDHEGHVAETAAGSLLIRSKGHWWTPAARCQLPGITIRQVEALLRNAGYEIERRQCAVGDLLGAETVWVLNSLIGIMPASFISGRPVPAPSHDEAGRLRKELFNRGRHTR